MTFETPSPAEDQPIPSLRLEEGKDFIDTPELYARIERELVERGYNPQAVLLCGHNQDPNESQPRQHTFANTMNEIQDGLKYASRTPYDEAIGTANGGQTPTITVYDGQQLQPSMEYAGEYETPDGRPVDSAALFNIELSVW